MDEGEGEAGTVKPGRDRAGDRGWEGERESEREKRESGMGERAMTREREAKWAGGRGREESGRERGG